MASEQEKTRTLEMRVAELEDKLSKMSVSEEEMKVYHKVSAALAGGAAAMGPSTTAQPNAPTYQLQPWWYRNWYHNWYWTYQQCYECGPGQPGPMTNPGTFGTFGR